jgi:hypothetical protein
MTALVSCLTSSSPGAPHRVGGLPSTEPGLVRRTREQSKLNHIHNQFKSCKGFADAYQDLFAKS